MSYDVSRRSLLALGAGFGASTMLGGNALAQAPKLGRSRPIGIASISAAPK